MTPCCLIIVLDLDLALNALCVAVLHDGAATISTIAPGWGNAAIAVTGPRAGGPRWVFPTTRHS
jgi:hypothetical protein